MLIAEKVLDARGWSPWPACSSRLGLDGSDAQGSPTAAAAPASDSQQVATRAANNREDAQPASRGKHRKAPPTHAMYVVRHGDTLSGIAAAKRVPGGWAHLYKINRSTIGSNPGLIRPGQRLRLG